ncbi:MAG: chromosomal replication initiator protein DnaA [Patescibacteria group bacterium]|nr:chromosomal replication initiator protein DnaA [Patescibacteria group bacterium]
MSALRAALADRVGQDRYELWFGETTRFDLSERALIIGAPNEFFQQWIRANFRKQIEQACFEAAGWVPHIEFRVEPAEASAPEGPMPTSDSNEASKSSRATGALGVVRNAAPQPARVSNVNGKAPRRLASFSDFVSGETNQIAFSTAQRVSRRPGETPLFLYGPTSVGKTHLLESICTEARKNFSELTIIYQSAEQFTSSFLEALRGSGLPSFRRKYRGVGLLILDDLHFLVGKRATRTELLHTVDTLQRDGRQLVFAADEPPGQLTALGPELVTRLQSGMVCRIDSPDHATRLGIVGQMAARLDMTVPEDVRQYIASRVTSHAREISGALCRLQATSEALCKPVTWSMAKDALGELLRQGGPVVRLPDIERAVCEVFELDSGVLQSGERTRSVSYPRMLAMWLARKHTRAALSEIGAYFGRRRHSTVVSAQQRVDGWMSAGASLDVSHHGWTADEAIRRIERKLEAG